MTIEHQIVDLEVLVAVDATIKELADKLETERSEISTVRTEVDELNGALETDRAAVIEMERTRQGLLQELRQIEQQVERSRDRLNRARNEREQNAAERELDELRKLRRDRDDEVKKIVALVEQARVTIDANETRHAELTLRLEGALPGATETMASLEEHLTSANDRRGAASAKLQSLTRRRYQSMHERGKTPVAYTTDGTCQGCYVGLPPMLFHTMLSRIRFEECPFCRRIIYYRPPPSEAEAADDAADEATGDAAGEAAGEATGEADAATGEADAATGEAAGESSST